MVELLEVFGLISPGLNSPRFAAERFHFISIPVLDFAAGNFSFIDTISEIFVASDFTTHQ
jgi:hypothetical protein